MCILEGGVGENLCGFSFSVSNVVGIICKYLILNRSFFMFF